jgi:hypothetical protein
MWYEFLLAFGVGFFLGAFVMALCAMARCADCKLIGQMWGEKK